MKNVLHFIRKKSQLKASFIYNQVRHHIDYQPFIVFRLDRNKPLDSGFAGADEMCFPCLNLAETETVWEKFLYKFFKQISARQVKRIEDFAIKNHIQVFHFHYGSDTGIFYPLIKKTTWPSVVSFYGYDCSGFVRYYWGYGRYYLRKRVFPYVTKVLAMSADMKKDILSLGCPAEKVIVHYHGTDVGLFKNVNKYSINAAKVNLLILAGLVPQKGHRFLLQALEQLVRRGMVQFELHVVGAGPLETSLVEFTQKSGLSPFVSFVGAVKYGSDEMFNTFRWADIFVHPSVTDTNGDKEGIPGAIGEAMACGLPVIATFHAGIPYVIENEKTGILVNEWDISALAEAIERLIKDANLRKSFGEAAKKYAMVHLNLADKEKELEAIYDTLVT